MTEPTIEAVSYRRNPFRRRYHRWPLSHSTPPDNHRMPPDPLFIAAREICARDCEATDFPITARRYRKGELDGDVCMRVVIAALKRGMELVQPKPTPHHKQDNSED